MLITTHQPRRFHAKPRTISDIQPSPSVRLRDSTTILSTPVLTAVTTAAVAGIVGGGFLAATGLAVAGAVAGGISGGLVSPALQKGLGYLTGANRIHADDQNLVTAAGFVLGGLGGLSGAVAGSLGSSPLGVAVSALAIGGTLMASVRILDHLDG